MRRWTEEWFEKKEVDEQQCHKERGQGQEYCSGGGSNRKCEWVYQYFDVCVNVKVWRDVKMEQEHNEYVPVEFTDRTIDASGTATVSFDGQTRSDRFSVKARTVSEKFVGSGNVYTKSVEGPGLQEQLTKDLKNTLSGFELPVRRSRMSAMLEKAEAARGNPDRAAGYYVMASVMGRELPRAAEDWLTQRHLVSPEELKQLLFANLEEAAKPTAQTQTAGVALALDLPKPETKMPEDVIALEKRERVRDEMGESAVEFHASLGMHQPNNRFGRVSNTGVTVGLRGMAG